MTSQAEFFFLLCFRTKAIAKKMTSHIIKKKKQYSKLIKLKKKKCNEGQQSTSMCQTNRTIHIENAMNFKMVNSQTQCQYTQKISRMSAALQRKQFGDQYMSQVMSINSGKLGCSQGFQMNIILS